MTAHIARVAARIGSALTAAARGRRQMQPRTAIYLRFWTPDGETEWWMTPDA
jgi:hypothetical protein